MKNTLFVLLLVVGCVLLPTGCGNEVEHRGPVFEAVEKTLSLSGESNPVKADLMARGLFTESKNGSTGEIKTGEIEKLVEDGVYIIDEEGYLQFGPSYTPPFTTDESIVQVWEPSCADGGEMTLLAFGIAVGDGSQVLTVLDYENYTPDGLEVCLLGGDAYRAVIQVIDPRTSVTLLKVEGAELPVMTLGDSAALETGQKVIVRGWQDNSLKALSSYISEFPGVSDMFFSASLSLEVLEEGNWGSILPGTPVINDKGEVVGLMSAYYDDLMPHSIFGAIPSVAGISNALELLATDAADRPWAGGPVLSVYTHNSSIGTRIPSLFVSAEEYLEIASAIRPLLSELGEPLSTDELPEHYIRLAWPRVGDDNLLTVVYAQPVALYSAAGEKLADAKWVGIHWDRGEGKPNCLYYGTTTYDRVGAFELLGDVTGLESISELPQIIISEPVR
jgi:hypothetical protein